MEGITIKNKDYNRRFIKILEKYSSKISKENLTLIKMVILRYKKYSDNEYYIVLTLIYWLVFFKAMPIEDKLITPIDRHSLNKIKETYLLDINGDFKEYLYKMLQLNEDLFILKIVIKYTLLNSQNNYLNIVPWDKKDNYFKSIWYLIPALTLKESKLLWFYQDIYFKNVYPKQYYETKSKHLEETSKLELPWEYIISIVNDLTDVMMRSKIEWNLKIRKKSYFSLYNKMRRKNCLNVSDNLWIRIIFRNMTELNTFIKNFEKDFAYIQKKDYIKSPKSNGYKSIHYSFINPFRTVEILVELQVRTLRMDHMTHEIKWITHFNYTIKENKWDRLFWEVWKWYEYLMSYIQIKKEKQLVQTK